MSRLIYLETCNSGYFSGFSGPVIAVSVDALTTKDALREGINADIQATMWEEFPFAEGELEKALDEVMENFTADYPFADIGADLDMPKGYFAVRNKDGSYALYEGDEDQVEEEDTENAELVEADLPSYAGAVIQAYHTECDDTGIEVYCYFGIQRD